MVKTPKPSIEKASTSWFRKSKSKGLVAASSPSPHQQNPRQYSWALPLSSAIATTFGSATT